MSFRVNFVSCVSLDPRRRCAVQASGGGDVECQSALMMICCDP